MRFNSNNLLVTGGSGFIGSNFIDFILNKYNYVNVINLDLLTYAGNLKNTASFRDNPRYTFIQGDICDTKLVGDIFNNFCIDGVINFAAESHVDNSIKNPSLFIKTNINGVFNLLNIAFKYWHKSPFCVYDKYKLARFHQVSTDEVYGSIIKGSFDENSPFKPNSPYSSSKASADLIVRSFNKTYGLNTTISHSSNNFGQNQNKEKFIPTILNSILNDKAIPLYGKGNNIRDWISVIDNCIAIELIFSNSVSGQRYNIGSGYELSNLELINLIYKYLPSPKNKDFPKIEYIKDRLGHDIRYSLNTDKIKSNLNWKPKMNFKDSLKKYLKNYE